MGGMNKLGSEPFIEKGYVYIPLRNVSELLGYKVDWDVSKRAATIIGINNKLVLNSSSNLAIKNGKSMKKMNPSMKMINNKNLCPIAIHFRNDGGSSSMGTKIKNNLSYQ